jgi:hypothetical protein
MVKESDSSIVDLLDKCTAKDLADVDQKIAAEESALGQLLKNSESKIASLRALRRVLDIMLNGKPQRKKREAKAAAPPSDINDTTLRLIDRVVSVVKQHGSSFPAAIARKLDVTEGQVNMAASHGVRAGRVKVLDDGRISLL